MAIDIQQAGEKRLREKLSAFLTQSGTARLPEAAKGARLEIQDIFGRIAEAGYRTFLFGGLLRHLMLRPFTEPPRDVDLVIDCKSNSDLYPLFADLPSKINRFGGIRLLTTIPVDIWALPETWAFKKGLWQTSTENLPHTTSFNIEAIVASLDVGSHHRRDIYSVGFFQGLCSRTLELNLEDNPFPALCITRAIVLAITLDFWIGSSLAEYIVRESAGLSWEYLEQIQRSHYGDLRLSARTLTALIADIRDQLEAGCDRIALPGSSKSQQNIWPNGEREAHLDW